MVLSDTQEEIVDCAARRRYPIILVNGFAGTGKSVIVREIADRIENVLLACHSGIASNNIGGQTICSLFGIPTHCAIDPNQRRLWVERQKDKKTAHFMPTQRYQAVVAANYLILDEVYATRCDHMDFIDKALRDARKQPQIPFGGLGLLMVGDEGQAAPITADDLEDLLGYGYRHPFDFRQAKVFKCAVET